MAEKSGKRLKTLREMAGLTQSEVGNRFNIDRSILSLIEGGHRPVPEDQQEEIETYLTSMAKKRAATVLEEYTA